MVGQVQVSRSKVSDNKSLTSSLVRQPKPVWLVEPTGQTGVTSFQGFSNFMISNPMHNLGKQNVDLDHLDEPCMIKA
jgi:hypothetical protein